MPKKVDSRGAHLLLAGSLVGEEGSGVGGKGGSGERGTKGFLGWVGKKVTEN